MADKRVLRTPRSAQLGVHTPIRSSFGLDALRMGRPDWGLRGPATRVSDRWLREPRQGPCGRLRIGRLERPTTPREFSMSVVARTGVIKMTCPPGVDLVGAGPLLHLDVLGVEEDG